MSSKPRIFVSAVASEFAALRLEVADRLERLGFEPLLSDLAESESCDQRPGLQQRINASDGLLQLVGACYGPEPPTIGPEFGRVSYAQFAYLYADQQGKKTWVILTRPGFSDDPSRKRPDAVSDPSARAAAERDDAERTQLQDDYRERLQAAGLVWREVADETELMLEIERLAGERAALCQARPAWSRIRRPQLAVLAVVAAICIVSWLVIHWHQNQVVARALASIDSGRIRTQLEKSIDAAYERDAARARQLGQPQQQKTALSAAAKRRGEKRADLDSVLDLLTGTIASGQASPQFLEMSHVLQQDGVDSALAWLSPREAALLEQAQAEAARRERGLRGALTPLLAAIPLLRERGDLADAERLCERLLAAEPDWLGAQAQQVVTAMQSGAQALAENRPMTAWQKFSAARTSAERLLKQDPRNRLSQGQLAAAYLELGELTYKSSRWGEADELLLKGLALAKKRAAADPSDFAAQWALLETYGKTSAIHVRLGHYGEALQFFKQGHQLAGTLAARAEHDEAVQRDLANWYGHLGKEFQYSGRARPEAYTANAEIRAKLARAHPQDVEAQRDLAAAYECLGSLETESGVSSLFFKSLEIRKRLAAGAPHEPEFQQELAALYEKLGMQTAYQGSLAPGEQKAVLMQQARDFYGQDLEITKKLAAARPADYTAQHNLAVCYEKLASFSAWHEPREAAFKYRREQLEILTKLAAADPKKTETQQEMAAAYDALGDLSWRAGQMDQARDSFQRAFDVDVHLAADNPADPLALSHVSQACANLARLAQSRGALDAAEKICRDGIALVTQLCNTPEGKEYLKSGVTNAMKLELRQCERTKIIRGPLQALLKQPTDEVPSLLSQRILLLAKGRDIDGVAKTAEALAKLEPKNAGNLYWAACGYAICAELASGRPSHGPFPPTGTAVKNSSPADAHAQSETQVYIRTAIELLEAAQKAGFKNLALAGRDSHFAALRDVPEFQKLVGGTPDNRPGPPNKK